MTGRLQSDFTPCERHPFSLGQGHQDLLDFPQKGSEKLGVSGESNFKSIFQNQRNQLGGGDRTEGFFSKPVIRSRLESIKKFNKTIPRNKIRLLQFVENRLANAAAEGFNRTIKFVKNRASGFRNLDAFSGFIYLAVRDLNIAEQIPVKSILY